MILTTIDEIRARIGEVVGVSSWIPIDQHRIDQFADATEDRQFIHVDEKAAARGPFGGTIAHGFLTLSLLSRMGIEVMVIPNGTSIAINYGLENVRFIAPVRAGKRVRGHFTLEAVEDKGGGRVLIRHRVSVEIDGEEKPALTATWLSYFVC